MWKDIKDYKRRYQISNFGRVKSLNYKRTNVERILKPIKDSNGYLNIILYQNRKI